MLDRFYELLYDLGSKPLISPEVAPVFKGVFLLSFIIFGLLMFVFPFFGCIAIFCFDFFRALFSKCLNKFRAWSISRK